MKALFIVALTAFSALANAQEYSSAKHAVYGAFGFTEGGFSLGADYEFLGNRDFGIGGYARIYQKDDDRALGDVPGVTTLGGFIRPHFNKKAWDLYVSPGFAIISIDSPYSGANAPDDATTFGPSLAIGLLYEMSTNVSLGVENMRHWVWFEDDWRGQITNDMMIKFRMTF